MTVMVARFLAILFLVVLTVLPAAGEASAFSAAAKCGPVAHAMVMAHTHEHASSAQDCDHGAGHRQMPCAMMGLCTMAGCMALTSIETPRALAAAECVAYRMPSALRIDGLALTPPMEPPRA